jgi:eukaryotic-like serine/threonine-protein kinase
MSETVALTQGLPSHIGPGLVIAGKYRLEAEIGRGSMGTVYRAVHVTLGQRVAIKLISTEHSQSAEARKRFSVEAKAAAKLRSRHVVQVYDDGETPEGNPYIVLEYLDGETLEQRLERERDIPLLDAARVVSHVGRALARAHAQGIVHRDLKPANIFLVKSDDDEVGWIAKVLDFGIAKLDGYGEKGTTQAGTVLGTPLFMSPEQVRGASSVDHRADLYSLGMCLFHMLTGEYAYYSLNYSEILVGICTQPLPLLRAKAPWVPESVEVWFQRACAKEPLERFQSADEMTEALQAAAGGAVLSKHKSFPEGRIAPETLVGYAAPPALATLHPDMSPASLARTQRVVVAAGAAAVSASAATSPGFGAPAAGERAAAPVAISVSSGDARSLSTDFTLPKRSVAPLFIGVGLGLLAVVSVVLTVLLLSGSDEKPRVAPDSATVASTSAPSPNAQDELSAAPRATHAPTNPPAVVSSVTAEPSTRPTRPTGPTAEPDKAKRAPPAKAAAPAAVGPKAAPQRPSGSDLGF